MKDMKKTLLAGLAAAVICTCNVGNADAVNWQQFGSDSAGVSWFIDVDSVQRNDNSATIDVKAQDSEGFHFIATEEFNRKDKTIRDVKVTLYNPQGYVEAEDPVDNVYRPVNAGSPSEAVYYYLWAPEENATVDQAKATKVDKKADKKAKKEEKKKK
ncbi:hypothetical protein [Veillonella agrestimuris]|uniref:hypothetical protein n=1 Tax=Veillonella agrestimuris TaxID=2941340 RepID=UPI0020426B0D|nr:hypothetical protein [Veillonella agrestimuris]